MCFHIVMSFIDMLYDFYCPPYQTAPGRCYLAGDVPKADKSGKAVDKVKQKYQPTDRGKGKAVSTTSEPKKRPNCPKEKLMSTAIRVGESYSDITETEYQLMTQALYNSTRETRRAGIADGEGQSTGVAMDFFKGGGTQESANKQKDVRLKLVM